jgi:iron complex transport system substrate-binding protein
LLFGYPGEETLTCGADTFIDDLISVAHATNIAHDAGSGWIPISAEFILTADPDWILTASSCSGGETLSEAKDRLLAEMQADPVWSKLTAVRRGNVIVIESDVLLRPGPRILDALQQVQTAIHGFYGGSRL